MQNAKQFILRALLLTATVAYPFAVYYGLQHVSVSWLALALLFLLLARVGLSKTFHQPQQQVLIALIGGLCLVSAWFNSEDLLRYYPVLMNLMFALAFALSLRSQIPLIERMVSAFKKDINQHAKRYMRGLTLAWAVLLLINAAVSFYTACCLSLSTWALYNGALAYLVFAVFTLFELCYRQYYKRQNPS